MDNRKKIRSAKIPKKPDKCAKESVTKATPQKRKYTPTKPPRMKRKAGEKALNPRQGEPIPLADMYDALVQGMGRYGRAADILGCHISTVSKYVKAHPELREAIELGEMSYNETLEQVAESGALQDDPRRDTLRIFMLKKRKPDRYGDNEDNSEAKILTEAMGFILGHSSNPAEYKQPPNIQ